MLSPTKIKCFFFYNLIGSDSIRKAWKVKLEVMTKLINHLKSLSVSITYLYSISLGIIFSDKKRNYFHPNKMANAN